MRISDWSSDVCSSDVPATLDRVRIAGTGASTSCARAEARHSRSMTVAEWRALGLVPPGKDWPAGGLRATLTEADGSRGPAFLAFDTYRALHTGRAACRERMWKYG